MFSADNCRSIHEASLEILKEVGVRVHHDEALSLLREADCRIEDTNLVKLPVDLVEWALKQPPSSIHLYLRGTDEVGAPLEGRKVNFGPGSDCPNFLDPVDSRRRSFTLADLVACIRLTNSLPQLDFIMSMGIPSDLLQQEGKGNVYLQQFALMLENSQKPIVFVCHDRKDCEHIVEMAREAQGGEDRLVRCPNLLLYSEPTSPLQHSTTATDKLLYMAEASLPVVHSPAPMMGGTAPASIAGGLVQGNAEILSGLVIHQLKKKGAPFVYGSGLHHMDMRTSISVYGAPEFQLSRAGVAAMAQHYSLPSWGYAGHSDSLVMDEQASADSVFSVFVALMTGTNLIHDVGYMEAGLMVSPEMMVFTCEIIDMLRSFMDGVPMDSEELCREVIQEAGPGGHYLTHDHTLSHFRRFWDPGLFERRRYEDWHKAGAKRAGDRIREKTLDLMDAAEPAPMSEDSITRIRRILEEAGAGLPPASRKS